jgi:hypothetical protein
MSGKNVKRAAKDVTWVAIIIPNVIRKSGRPVRHSAHGTEWSDPFAVTAINHISCNREEEASMMRAMAGSMFPLPETITTPPSS